MNTSGNISRLQRFCVLQNTHIGLDIAAYDVPGRIAYRAASKAVQCDAINFAEFEHSVWRGALPNTTALMPLSYLSNGHCDSSKKRQIR